MSIIPKLVILGLAATLGSPIQQSQIAYSAGDPSSNRINQLWLVTYLDETGLEVVAQAKLNRRLCTVDRRGSCKVGRHGARCP
jgi:hypothetical protein